MVRAGSFVIKLPASAIDLLGSSIILFNAKKRAGGEVSCKSLLNKSVMLIFAVSVFNIDKRNSVSEMPSSLIDSKIELMSQIVGTDEISAIFLNNSRVA